MYGRKSTSPWGRKNILMVEAKRDPTPEEIRRECKKIQAEWTKTEQRSRRVQPVPHWEVPQARDKSRERPQLK